MIFDFKHLRNCKHTYAEHFYRASFIGVCMIIGGLAAVVHAVFPFAFYRTASNIVSKLIDEVPNFPSERAADE